MITLAQLVTRPTAEGETIRVGDQVWYWQTTGGNHGTGQLVPAVFIRYGVIRVAIGIFDAEGHDHRIYVSPRNVYRRRPGDSGVHPGDQGYAGA